MRGRRAGWRVGFWAAGNRKRYCNRSLPTDRESLLWRGRRGQATGAFVSRMTAKSIAPAKSTKTKSRVRDSDIAFSSLNRDILGQCGEISNPNTTVRLNYCAFSICLVNLQDFANYVAWPRQLARLPDRRLPM